MIKPGHLYKCVWAGELEAAFYNVVTEVTPDEIIGYCQFADIGKGLRQPDCDSSNTSWKPDSFNTDHTHNKITDLGPLETFKQTHPELFI